MNRGKFKKMIMTGLLTLSMTATAVTGFLAETVQAEETGGQKELNIAFIHDLHSYLDSYTTEVDGEASEVGGVARLKTMIDEKKEADPETLVVDGGDFSMGTLYQTMFSEDACELRMLGAIGVEATTKIGRAHV